MKAMRTGGIGRNRPLDLDRIMTRLNGPITWLLRSPFHFVLDSGLMLVTVTGRRSGKRYTIPVGYQDRSEHIDVLVSKARRKKWWRNYLDAAPIEVLRKGRSSKGTARVLTAGSDAFYASLQQTFDRMPWLSRQFGIRYSRENGLSAGQRRRLARSAAVVRIEFSRERQRRQSADAAADEPAVRSSATSR